MNKTDNLYGGFAVVAIAGIVAMMVSVFSPPKQRRENKFKTFPTRWNSGKETSRPLECNTKLMKHGRS